MTYAFTSHREGMKRYFLRFDLPTNPICWLRGHRAKAEAVDTECSGSWVLVTCRTCGIRHSDPYLSRGRNRELSDRERAQEELARQVQAARNNNANYARVRDGRDGYGHHELELTLEVVTSTWRTPGRTPGLHLHIGDRWSETPFDGSLHGRKGSAYFSVGGVGNRFAHWLTKGKKRDLTIGAKHKEIS